MKETTRVLRDRINAVLRGHAAAVWVGILVAIVFITKSEITIDPYLMPRFTVLAAGVAVSLTFLIARVVKGSERIDTSVMRRAVFPLWLAYLSVVGISIFVAVNPSEALFDWLKSVVIFSFFLVLILFLSTMRRGVAVLVTLMTLVCLALATIGSFQFAHIVSKYGLTFDSTYQIQGLSGHRNLFSQTLLLTAPFAACGAFVARGLWRVACSVALVLITGLMVRSVWIAAFAASMTKCALLYLVSRLPGVTKPIRGVGLPLAIGAVVIGGTVMVGSMMGAADTFATQLRGIVQYNEGNAVPRLFLWGRTGEMVLDHPLLGVGAGNWRIVSPRYTGGSKLVEGGWKPPQKPHNDLLWMLAETGVIGLSLYLALYFTILWCAARRVWIAPNRDQRIQASTIWFALVSYFVFSLFSFPRERLEHSMLLAMVFAMVVLTEHRLRPIPTAVRRTVVLVFLLAVVSIVLISFGFGVMRVSSEIHTMRAYAERNAGRYNVVVEQISCAYSPVTTVDRAAFPLLYYRGVAFSKLGQAERAHEDYWTAYRDSPFTLPVVKRLAMSCAKRGEYVDSELLWKKALEIDPQCPNAVLNLAHLYTSSHRDDEALEMLRRYDPKSEDQLYLYVLLPLLKRHVNRIASLIDDEQVVTVLQRSAMSDDWLRTKFKLSIFNSTSFAEEVLSSLPLTPSE